MSIFDQVMTLELPIGEYAVIGSGVMSAYGIRVHNDVDLVVTKELYEELKQKGWKTKMVTPNFEVIENGIFEASPEMITLPNYRPDINSMIKNADIIQNIAFASLNDVIDFKRALGRDKDLVDIQLIQAYLSKKK